MLIESFNKSFQDGELSSSQKQAIITVIDKKDRNLLKNWLPISLLNVDYKIISKTLAECLTEIMPKIIKTNQTGYIKSRYSVTNK